MKQRMLRYNLGSLQRDISSSTAFYTIHLTVDKRTMIMKLHSHRHNMPSLHGLIDTTREKVGNGLAVLMSDKIRSKQRQAVGWTLLGVGLLAAIPLLFTKLFRGSHEIFSEHAHHHNHIPAEARG